MSRRQAPLIFISHSSKDWKLLEKVAGLFEANELRYWHSRRDLIGSQQWHDEIGRALRRCNWFIVLLTPDAVKSRWVKTELLYALTKSRYNDRIVPVILKKCDPEKLSWTLSSIEYVDLKGSKLEDPRKLLDVWKRRATQGRRP